MTTWQWTAAREPTRAIELIGSMSTRGVNFLHKWLSANITSMAGSDVISVAEAVQKMFADAKAIGIGSQEIEEDSGSVYETVLDAVVHYEGGKT